MNEWKPNTLGQNADVNGVEMNTLVIDVIQVAQDQLLDSLLGVEHKVWRTIYWEDTGMELGIGEVVDRFRVSYRHSGLDGVTYQATRGAGGTGGQGCEHVEVSVDKIIIDKQVK